VKLAPVAQNGNTTFKCKNISLKEKLELDRLLGKIEIV